MTEEISVVVLVVAEAEAAVLFILQELCRQLLLT